MDYLASMNAIIDTPTNAHAIQDHAQHEVKANPPKLGRPKGAKNKGGCQIVPTHPTTPLKVSTLGPLSKAETKLKFIQDYYTHGTSEALAATQQPSYIGKNLTPDSTEIERTVAAFLMFSTGSNDKCLTSIFRSTAKDLTNRGKTWPDLIGDSPKLAATLIRRLSVLMAAMCEIGGNTQEFVTSFLMSYDDGYTPSLFSAGVPKAGNLLLSKQGEKLTRVGEPVHVIRQACISEVETPLFGKMIHASELAETCKAEFNMEGKDILYLSNTLTLEDFKGFYQKYTITCSGVTTEHMVVVRIPKASLNSTAFRGYPFPFLKTKAVKACYKDALRGVTNLLDEHDEGELIAEGLATPIEENGIPALLLNSS